MPTDARPVMIQRGMRPGGVALGLCAVARWVHLRLCLSCGHVGCCDESPGTHATKHFHHSRHALIKSLEPGEDWAWCYVDELMMEPAPEAP